MKPQTLGVVRGCLSRAILGLSLLSASALALAQVDPPGRVGRMSDVQGNVSWFDHEQGQWGQAERNLPLTGGDRIATAPGGRVELRVGSTVLRVGGGSEVEVLRLDDERISLQLHSGNVALRVRSRDIAQELELITAEVRLQPLTAGHFRLDRIDDTTQLSSWRGDVRIDDAAGFVVVAGQRVNLHRQSRTGELRAAWAAPVSDAFAAWVERDEQLDERSASTRYVSPEMTGVEDLDRHGRWEQHPEYGAVWLPVTVAVDWAPYRYGRWTWVRPWGWTWVDDARWGFAPFHYGRWANWRGRWCWVPGAYAVRPVYAPALVAWVGGAPGVSVNVRIGGGWGAASIGWVALAPREVFVPRYGVSPGYHERVNPGPPERWHHRPGHAPNHHPTGPIMYGNQAAPNGVTVVAHDVLLQRRPVGAAWDAATRGDGRGDRSGRGDESRRPGAQPDFRQTPLVATAPPTPAVVATPPGFTGPARPTFPREPGRVDVGPDRPDRAQRPQAPVAERSPVQMVPGGAEPSAPMQRPQMRPPVQAQQPTPAPSSNGQPGAAVQAPVQVAPQAPVQVRPVPVQAEDRRDMPQRPDRTERGAPREERRERVRPQADFTGPVPSSAAPAPTPPTPAPAPAAAAPRAPAADKPMVVERAERVERSPGPERVRAPERERAKRDDEQPRQSDSKREVREVRERESQR
jgi:hypothetical protein